MTVTYGAPREFIFYRREAESLFALIPDGSRIMIHPDPVYQVSDTFWSELEIQESALLGDPTRLSRTFSSVKDLACDLA